MSDAARSLHSLITAFSEAKGAHAFARWEIVFETDQESLDFAERHAAVVALWRETVASIKSMPESKTRERRLAYGNQWWRAVVLPQPSWGEQTGKVVMSQGALDMLDSVAETLAELDGRPPTQVVDSALASLRSFTEDWIARINSDDGLPRSLRMVLVERLESLRWFIDHADQFGVASIIRSGETATGALIRAAVEKQRPSWLTKIVGLVGALTLITTGVSTSIDAVQDIYLELEAGVTGHPDPDSPGGPSDGEPRTSSN